MKIAIELKHAEAAFRILVFIVGACFVQLFGIVAVFIPTYRMPQEFYNVSPWYPWFFFLAMIIWPWTMIGTFILPFLFIKEQKRIDITVAVLLYMAVLIRCSGVSFYLPNLALSTSIAHWVFVLLAASVIYLAPCIYAQIHRSKKSILIVLLYELCLLFSLQSLSLELGTAPKVDHNKSILHQFPLYQDLLGDNEIYVYAGARLASVLLVTRPADSYLSHAVN